MIIKKSISVCFHSAYIRYVILFSFMFYDLFLFLLTASQTKLNIFANLT